MSCRMARFVFIVTSLVDIEQKFVPNSWDQRLALLRTNPAVTYCCTSAAGESRAVSSATTSLSFVCAGVQTNVHCSWMVRVRRIMLAIRPA